MQKYIYTVMHDVVSRVMSFARNIIGLGRLMNLLSIKTVLKLAWEWIIL